MKLKDLLEFKIFSIDGMPIEILFSNLKVFSKTHEIINKNDFISYELSIDKRETKKNIEKYLKILEDEYFIKIDDKNNIKILKDIDYSKNEQNA